MSLRASILLPLRSSRSTLGAWPCLLRHCSRSFQWAPTSVAISPPLTHSSPPSAAPASANNNYGASAGSVGKGDNVPRKHTYTTATTDGSGVKAKEFSANSNPSEVTKFSSFASHWWDSRSNPLVGMNPIRVKFIRQVVSDFRPTSEPTNETPRLPLTNARILDIGCGGGLLTESLSRLGASLVVGVDASPTVVDVAKMHSFHDNSRLTAEKSRKGAIDSEAHVGNVRYIGGLTVEELASRWLPEREKEQASSQTKQPHDHELFDIVTALEVIEHVPNPASLLRAAATLLKPDGMLFVSTINRTMKSYGLAIVAAEYVSGKVPVGTHDWNQFWSPAEVERLVCGVNMDSSHHMATLKQVGLSGMVIKPPYVNLEWSLDPLDIDVNWIGAYQKQSI